MAHLITHLTRNLAPVYHVPIRKGNAGTSSSSTSAASTGQPADDSSSSSAPDFRALFSGTVTPALTAPPPNPAPTAESVFGPNPWVQNPTCQGPGGIMIAYNPFYFATPDTAAKVAAMVGGTVVDANVFTPNGGAFMQGLPNKMVQLPDGNLINPGLIASFYTQGYPQNVIDQMIANEVRNT